jgi:hypothetical protein
MAALPIRDLSVIRGSVIRISVIRRAKRLARH